MAICGTRRPLNFRLFKAHHWIEEKFCQLGAWSTNHHSITAMNAKSPEERTQSHITNFCSHWWGWANVGRHETDAPISQCTSLQCAQQPKQWALMTSILILFSVVFCIMSQWILDKLPFVERLLNLVLKQSLQILGQSWDSVASLFGSGVTEVQQVLEGSKINGEQIWDMIQHKIREIYQQIQGLIPEKD